MKYQSAEDFKEQAKLKITENAYNYYSSGANGEVTMKDNELAFKRIFLKQVIPKHSKSLPALSRTIFGIKVSTPIGIAPSAMHKLVASEGEVATARAARNLGIIYTMSTYSTTSMEEVVKESGSAMRFFQLYITKNRDLSAHLVKKAEELGFKALVLTCDAPIMGKREADERGKFHLPSPLKLEVLASLYEKLDICKNQKEDQGFMTRMFINQVDPSITWDDVKWLKSISKLPLVVKGIHCAEDASLAIEAGVDGVWISNHGGRQLDTVPAAIDILPEVVEVTRKSRRKIEVFIDSGFRAGSDIIKALCIGADCVFLGRLPLWGLACEGSEGIEKVVKMLNNQMYETLAMMGNPDLISLTSSNLCCKL